MSHISLTRRSNYQYSNSPFLYGEQPSDSDLLHSLGLGVVGKDKALVRSCLFLLSQWHDEIALTQLINRLRIYILNGQAESESEDWQWFIAECEHHCQGTKDTKD